jgi:hypothetical protein
MLTSQKFLIKNYKKYINKGSYKSVHLRSCNLRMEIAYVRVDTFKLQIFEMFYTSRKRKSFFRFRIAFDYSHFLVYKGMYVQVTCKPNPRIILPV